MKNLLIALTFILTFSSCQSKEETSKTLEKEAVFRLSEHYSKFKFHDLKEFKDDTFEYDERRKQYKELDSLALKQIIQGDEQLVQENGTFFYYSTFKDSTLIAVIQETSDENGAFIWLLKYDNQGKLRNKMAIAGGWGDAGDSEYYYGKLLKDNAFVTTRISSSIFEDDIETSRIATDSTVIKFNFQANNILKIDTLVNKSDTISQSVNH